MVDCMATDEESLKMGETETTSGESELGTLSSNFTYKNASKFYEEAAISYKTARSWDEAGSAYIKLAESHLKMHNKHEAAAATAFVDAAHCYKRISPTKAISCLQQAVQLFSYTSTSSSLAAQYCKEIGELYEQESDFEKAIIHHERAIELFNAEGATTSVNQCKQKVAQYFAVLLQYPKAIEIYEEITREAANSNMLRYEVRGYLLSAGLCHMCNGDVDAVTTALQKYQELDATFSKTQECKLLADLVEAYDEGNVEKYTEVLKEYDSVTPLFCSWKRVLLMRIKEKLKAKIARCKAINV